MGKFHSLSSISLSSSEGDGKLRQAFFCVQDSGPIPCPGILLERVNPQRPYYSRRLHQSYSRCDKLADLGPELLINPKPASTNTTVETDISLFLPFRKNLSSSQYERESWQYLSILGMQSSSHSSIVDKETSTKLPYFERKFLSITRMNSSLLKGNPE